MLPYEYEMKTTLWMDFSIADRFGKSAIKDTFKRAFEWAKTDYKALTELALVTNWKCWNHYDSGNGEISEIYSKMYYKVRNYAYKHLKGEEIRYYFEMTD